MSVQFVQYDDNAILEAYESMREVKRLVEVERDACERESNAAGYINMHNALIEVCSAMRILKETGVKA